MMEWMESKGGIRHPQIDIRLHDPSDPKNSYFGVFTNGPIAKDELLLRIPPDIIISVPVDEKDEGYYDSVCDLAWKLKDEYELGNNSVYAPYINYLKAQPNKAQIPALWSLAGQHLLLQVQGDLTMNSYDSDEKGEVIVTWLYEWYEKDCMDGSKREEEESGNLNPYFLAVTIQRGFDRSLIPVYDMINHHNGEETINSITRPSIFHEDGFGVYALRDLEAGEEVLFPYYGCPDCKDTLEYWGTPEMLRDFGFVEDYPHRFHFREKYSIYIDRNADGTFTASCKNDKCPGKAFAEHQLERLSVLYDTEILASQDFLPRNEYYVIVQYHRALTVAFAALLEISPEGEDTVSVTEDNWDSEDEEDEDDEDGGAGEEDGEEETKDADENEDAEENEENEELLIALARNKNIDQIRSCFTATS
eukprot:scaffold406_cov57-Cylindrotheca_fusiformis.AAC.8